MSQTRTVAPSRPSTAALLRQLLPFGAIFYASFAVLLAPRRTNLHLHGWALAAELTIGTALLAAPLLVPSARQPVALTIIGPWLWLGLMVAIRHTTGGGSSPLSILVLIPPVWTALNGTRRQLLLTLAATALAYEIPAALIGAPRYPNTEYARGVLWVGVLAVLCLAVHGVVTRERRIIAQIHKMQAQQNALSALRDHAAQEVQNRERLLSAVLENIDTAVLACDAEGTVTIVNQTMREMTGAQIVIGGSHVDDLTEGRYYTDGTAVRTTEPTAFQRALRGETIRNQDRVLHRGDNGMRLWISTNAGPLRDADGAVSGAVVSVRDVTPRVNAQREVQRARDRLRRFIDAVTEQGIVGVDPTGTVTLFNPGAEQLLGRSADEVVGVLSLADWHDPDELRARAEELGLPPDVPPVQALLETARQRRFETRPWTLVRADQTRFDASISVTTIADEVGGSAGFLAVIADISAQRATERLKDQFVAMVSHELRTPLSSIVGYLELLTDDPRADFSPNQQRYLATVERNAQRLLRLVGDLLFAAQVEAGTVTVRRGPTDLGALVEHAVESAAPKAAALAIELECRLDAEYPNWFVDGDRIGQAVDNLLTNAIKFTPAGGRVQVRLTDDPQDAANAAIEVSDTGPGIPASEQEFIFDAFFRTRAVQAAAIPGIGLGLTICRAIAETHGGHLDLVRSTPEGTTFRLVLPAG